MMRILAVTTSLLLIAPHGSLPVTAFTPTLQTRQFGWTTRQISHSFPLRSTPFKDDDDQKEENPYADPNYPDLEFVNYADPEYHVDQGEEYFDSDSTEAQIEEMREERRRRNDEYQFQTYYQEILKNGDEYKGEWTVYKTSTFMPGKLPHDANGMPRLVKTKHPIKVVSRGYKSQVESLSEYSVDNELIHHEEVVVAESDPSWQQDLDIGRFDESEKIEERSPEQMQTEQEIMGNTYWPSAMKAVDFRGLKGIMCVGNAYTICTAVPLLNNDDDSNVGPFGQYRAEVGIQSQSMRFRIKFDYAVKPDEVSNAHPHLHLKSMTVCRETREMWPRQANSMSVLDNGMTEALFGAPGAQGGLYDPPPVGCDEQAGQYMLLDLEGRATVLFPYKLDQDPTAFDGNGWVTSLDWTPGSIRYQVDRKTLGGAELLGLRTLELSEVQSEDADTYRPRDGGKDMRQ